MALVKKPTESNDNAHQTSASESAKIAEAQRKRARTLAKQQQAAERIAAATGQLASGIAEASSASEELKRASDQIATGAEEASGAAQESLTAFKLVTENIRNQLDNARISLTKTENIQSLSSSTGSGINRLVANVSVAASRQAASVEMVAELENQAKNIGEIVKAVVRIADQTNLLALNAAIEAARAGKHGKGFAVVADEVRTLAETSEKSAKQIQDLVSQIQKEVQAIAIGIKDASSTVEGEVEKGKTITEQLTKISDEMDKVLVGVQEIASGAEESDSAALMALKGSEEIAAAAEEQSAAAMESAKTVSQQTSALTECEHTAQALSELADDLRNSTDVAKSAEDVASSAEELSSAVQEINRAATQIMTAISQISRGAQTAAAASEESAAAVSQIEKGATIAQERSEGSSKRIEMVETMLTENKTAVDQLIVGINGSVEATRVSIKQVKDLEQVSRKIDKIVEAITTVSIQTNMLAVNGSIEAARAGEFGKGFVVVSTDIRNLARDSAENADRIKDLVKAVQDQIFIVGQDLEEIVESATTETEQAKASGDNLKTIEADVKGLKNTSDLILRSANEISSACVQAKMGIEQISTAAQEAEKAAEEASGAATQQSNGAEELSAAIEEIASLADELQSL